MSTLKTKYHEFRAVLKKDPQRVVRVIIPVVMMGLMLFLAVSPSFAQDPVATVELEIDPTTLTNQLFTGANIVIGALGLIMFLLAGFRLGGTLLRGIVDAVGGIRF